MKRTSIFSAFGMLSLVLVLSSCKSSRVWESRDHQDRTVRTPPPPPPRQYSPAPQPRQYSPAQERYSSSTLIISPRPGFTMNQSRDGNYFHRSPQGFLYWKGHDNRFYLDRSYLNRISYSKWEYKEWKQYKKDATKNKR